MAVVISTAMAPNCTPSTSLIHGSSRLSRASSGASMPPPPALAKKDAQDTLFTDEEFQALMSGQCEFLSFSDENGLQPSPSPSPLLSLQLQAHQLLCRDDACASFQDQETPPPPFALDDLLEAPISDDDIERLAPLFCDEEIQALCAAPAPAPPPQQESMQFSTPPSDDQHAATKRMPSPPWPSCIADDNDDDESSGAAGPSLPPSPPPPPTKKARTQTNSTSRREQEPPPSPLAIWMIKKKARTQTKTRSRPEHAAARAERLRKWHSTIANRILARQFRAPELSRGRTALRCHCPELALLAGGGGGEPRGSGLVGCCACALHQDALPEHRAWMLSAPPVLVGGPGKVLTPAASAGSSKATVLQYARWRRSVSMPSRFYVQRAAEKGLDRSAA